eukprot:scaffold9964_cov111-Isochrysis_galbana.AAC.4
MTASYFLLERARALSLAKEGAGQARLSTGEESAECGGGCWCAAIDVCGGNGRLRGGHRALSSGAHQFLQLLPEVMVLLERARDGTEEWLTMSRAGGFAEVGHRARKVALTSVSDASGPLDARAQAATVQPVRGLRSHVHPVDNLHLEADGLPLDGKPQVRWGNARNAVLEVVGPIEGSAHHVPAVHIRRLQLVGFPLCLTAIRAAGFRAGAVDAAGMRRRDQPILLQMGSVGVVPSISVVVAQHPWRRRARHQTWRWPEGPAGQDRTPAKGDVALIIACVTRYTGYEGERLEGPCPHQSSEQLVDEDNRGHHSTPRASRRALDALGTSHSSLHAPLPVPVLATRDLERPRPLSRSNCMVCCAGLASRAPLLAVRLAGLFPLAYIHSAVWLHWEL